MNIEIIKSKYPKGYDQLRKYITSLISKEVTSEVLAAFPMDTAIQMTFSNSQSIRSLWDFFDAYEIYMTISYKDKYWHTSIDNKMISPDGTAIYKPTYKIRIEAEEIGFTKCFEILEKKLNL